MITIPKKQYVGMQRQHGDKVVPLGFATPYDDTAAFEKRKDTVDSWARPRPIYEPVTPQGKWVLADPQPEAPTAKIIDNELLHGFKISESVRRYGWGKGNVVWRLEDPRGFELEISSANFASIIDCCTIVNGLITDRCIWGRDGGVNILLPENSQPYIDATINTERVSTSVSAKELTSGDIVLLKDGTQCTYYGSFHVAVMESKQRDSHYNGYNRYNRTRITDYNFVSKKRYIFGVIKDDSQISFVASSNLNVSRIVTKVACPVNVEDMARTISAVLNETEVNRYQRIVPDAIFVSSKPIKQYVPVLVPTTVDQVVAEYDAGAYSYYRKMTFVDLGTGGYCFVQGYRSQQGSQQQVKENWLVKLSSPIPQAQLHSDNFAVDHNDAYSEVRKPIEDFAHHQWYTYALAFDGINYPICGY